MAVCSRTLPLKKGLQQVLVRVGSTQQRVFPLCSSRAVTSCTPLASWVRKQQFTKTHHCRFSTRVNQSEKVSVAGENEELSEAEALESDALERIKSLSPEMEKKLKVIKLEYEVMLHMGDKVAENMTDSMWMRLFDCETKSARRKLHLYFRRKENYRLAHDRKRAIRREQYEERRNAFETGEIEKPPLNTFVLKLRKRTMLTYYNSRLASAMMFGSPLLIDLGFEDSMQQREIVNLSEQLMLCHGCNKVHREPFHLVFCNVRENSGVLKSMQKQSGLLPLDEYMFTITDKSYLDLYPRHKLVYLTPNAKDVMTRYDYDKVYIVGGIVDKVNPKPLTMAKAKREGITMAKLPLDYYHKWERGTKSLTLDQMIRIMLDIQMTQDWFKAFRHLPARKIVQDTPGNGRTFKA